MKLLTDIELRAHWFREHPDHYLVTEDTVLTPAARDFLKEHQIALVTESGSRYDPAAAVGESAGRKSGTEEETRGNENEIRSLGMNSSSEEHAGRLQGMESPAGGNDFRPFGMNPSGGESAVSPSFTIAATGERVDRKPEHMTHLRGNLLVNKDHPRIVLRGRLDSLEAKIMETQQIALQEGRGDLCGQLQELVAFVQRLIACEVKGESVGDISLLGLNSREIREMSHQVQENFGIAHPLPNYRMGKICVALNRLRTAVRETELQAVHTFGSTGEDDCPDPCRANQSVQTRRENSGVDGDPEPCRANQRGQARRVDFRGDDCSKSRRSDCPMGTMPPHQCGNGGGEPYRKDIIEALNRLSSCVYILFCGELTGRRPYLASAGDNRSARAAGGNSSAHTSPADGNSSAQTPLAGIPVEASGRHVHLTKEAIRALFGKENLTRKSNLSQPGQFAAAERVTLMTSKGEIEHVAVLGPPRKEVQVEISLTDARLLGIDVPVNLSGNLNRAADVILKGPCGIFNAPGSAIASKAHIHMTPEDAKQFRVRNGDSVAVRLATRRPVTIDDVTVRVSEEYALAMHLDYDEANACQFEKGDLGYIL